MKNYRWRVKHFATPKAQNDWTEKNRHKFQIVPLFINNGYAAEFRLLKQL